MSEFELIEKCRVLLSFNAKYIDFSEDLRDLIDELNQWKRNGRNMELVNINAMKREHNALLKKGQKLYAKIEKLTPRIMAIRNRLEEIEGDNYDGIPLIFGGGYTIEDEETAQKGGAE